MAEKPKHLDQVVTDIIIGLTWRGHFELKNAAGQPLDLAGKTVNFAIRDPTSGLRIAKSYSGGTFDLVTDTGGLTVIRVTLLTTETARLAEREHFFQLWDAGAPSNSDPLAAGQAYPQKYGG